MTKYRVVTPGPILTIEASSLDRATAIASNGLPVAGRAKGWTLRQTEQTHEGVVVRRVHLFTKHGNLKTGFAIREVVDA